MSYSFTGGCACGSIRYECSGKPIVSFNCHCRACQQYTGSAYISASLFPADTFTLTQGNTNKYVTQGDSGDNITREFCGVCGSPVVTRLARRPDVVGIPAASMDDPSAHKPSVDVYTAHAQPWDYMHPDLPKFPEAPVRK
jgi:hypothetical protein